MPRREFHGGVREMLRICGVLELVAAIWLVYTAIVDLAGPMRAVASDALQIPGGVYVSVRGLDNIENGLSAFLPQLQGRWRYLFFGPVDTAGRA